MTELEKAQARIIELLDEREAKRIQYEREIAEETKWKEIFKSRTYLYEEKMYEMGISYIWKKNYSDVELLVDMDRFKDFRNKITTEKTKGPTLLDLVNVK